MDHPFTVTEQGIDELVVDLDWPTPDDFDLEVYRKRSDDSLQQVATSGNAPGEKERVEMAAPAPGTYVLRVVNFAASSPSYTLKAALLNEEVISSQTIPGEIERWTLTCEKKARCCSASRSVDRGDRRHMQ